MRLEMLKKYPNSITFISKENICSLFVRTQKLNWEVIDEFKFNNNTYLSLEFDMKKFGFINRNNLEHTKQNIYRKTLKHKFLDN